MKRMGKSGGSASKKEMNGIVHLLTTRIIEIRGDTADKMKATFIPFSAALSISTEPLNNSTTQHV
ncbi:hypothetical protein [Paenibacillus lautus]|uniref:hypothetical protein n=1 Tax=Paenibacillus lautus TaxID=1401 RepID=UPI001C7CB5C2|nr:hypothetical protein [Paenibacillus lautus]